MGNAKVSNIFKKIADASATGGGNNIRDGRYLFSVEKCHIQEGHTGTCAIVEFRVMESTMAEGILDESGRQVVPNPVGSTCSMVANLTKHESAAGNVKAFIQAALGGLGYAPDEITDEVIADAFSEANPLRGVKVIDETYRGINKGRANAANAGKPLTLNKWKSVEQTQEDLEAAAKYLDDNAAKAEVVKAAATTTTTAQVAAANSASVSDDGTEVAAKPKTGGLLKAMKRT